VTKTVCKHKGTLSLLAASALLAACGGGGGEGGGGSGLFQAISFSYPGGATLLAGPVTLKATADSGLPVAFTSGTPDICTVSGDQLTLLAKGECRVTASQAGGPGAGGKQWAAADDVGQLFTVLGHAQTPVVPVAVMLRAATATVTLSAKTDAGLAAAYQSSTPSICTVSGNALTVLGSGLCQLAVTAPADASHEALTGTAIIAVSPLPPPVVQSQGRTQTVALAAVDAAGSALSYASTAPAVCTVAGSELRILAKGTCTVTLSSAGGATENLGVVVDPHFFASGFNPATSRTLEFGDINTGAGVPIAGWCGGADPSFCHLTVTSFSSTFGFDIKQKAGSGWDGSTSGWWAYYNYEIGAPKTQSGDRLPFDLKTEESLFVTLGLNQTLFDGGGALAVRIQTNNLQKKPNGDECYITASVNVQPASAAPTAYFIPLKNFSVTETCGTDIAQTAEAGLAQIRSYGVRALQFGPSVNLSRPTPNADGSLPAPADAAYTLSTDVTVFGPITFQ
jgi:hypothetical protein